MTLRPLHATPRPAASVRQDEIRSALRRSYGTVRVCRCGRSFKASGIDNCSYCSITCRELYGNRKTTQTTETTAGPERSR